MNGIESPIPVTVINWNGLEDTRECMEALLRQTHPGFRIILVDNGSGGGEGELLRELYGGNDLVELVMLEENTGFRAATNHVLERLLSDPEAADFVAMCNNDAVPDPTWLSNLCDAARKTGADILSSKMLYYFDPEKMDNAGHMMLNTGEIIPIGHMQAATHFDEPFENFGACAGAALYSTAMLRDIGLLDDYFDTGYEDAELGARAVVCGYRSVYVPDAKVLHKISRSLSRVRNRDYLIRIQRAIFYSYLKLMPAGYLLLHIPVILLRYLLIFGIDLIFFRWRAMRIQVDAIATFFRDDYKRAMLSRSVFQRGRKLIGTGRLIRKVRFFLPFDIGRFIRYVILRRRLSFDLPDEKGLAAYDRTKGL